MARTLIFNYKKDKEIVLNQWEHNETIVKFEGYQKVNANEVIYFILRTNDFKMDLPLNANNSITIQQPMVVKSGEFRGQLCRCLVTTNDDDEEVLELLDTNPPTFKVTVLRRMRPEQDTEIEDVTLDLWAQDMQTLYNQTNTLKTNIQTKLQNGEFKGEKGDTGATGAKGDKGDPGSDASVTSSNIISALGYTPSNDSLTAKKSDLLQLPSTKDSDASGVDLDVSDENGNVIARFKDGHIKTKNFDSSNISGDAPTIKGTTETESDLDVADRTGNVIVRFKDGHVKTKKFDSKRTDVTPIVITVKKDGTGDFDNLRDAVDSITDANSETNPYTIEIYKGTYNVFDDYTEEEILSAGTEHYTDTSFVGIKLTDGINLKGIGAREEVVIHGEVSSSIAEAIRNNLSTLNTVASGTIENVTVKAKNIRYCIHDDFGSPDYFTRIIKNCKFNAYNLTSGSEQKTIGCGARQGSTQIYEDCDFGQTFSWHSSNQASAVNPSTLIMKNCKGLSASISNYDHSIINRIHMYDCDFYYTSFNHTSVSVTSDVPRMTVDGTGCNNGLIKCPSGWFYDLGNVQRFRYSTEIPIGTMVKYSGTYYYTNSIEATTDRNLAFGIVIGSDDNFVYVQTYGFINSNILGLSGLSVGDYVKVDSNGKVTTDGTSDNAVGIVQYVYSDVAHIKMLVGGM